MVSVPFYYKYSFFLFTLLFIQTFSLPIIYENSGSGIRRLRIEAENPENNQELAPPYFISKTFKAESSGKNNYRIILKFDVLKEEKNYLDFVIVDDIRSIIATKIYYDQFYNSSGTKLSFYFKRKDNQTFVSEYSMKVNKPASKTDLYVKVYKKDNESTSLAKSSVCIDKATFSDNITKESTLYIVYGILLGLIILIIIILVICLLFRRTGRTKERNKSVKQSVFNLEYFENKNVNFGQSITSDNNDESKINFLVLENQLINETDVKMEQQFLFLNFNLFKIWLNQAAKKYSMSNKKDEILQKLKNEYDRMYQDFVKRRNAAVLARKKEINQEIAKQKEALERKQKSEKDIILDDMKNGKILEDIHKSEQQELLYKLLIQQTKELETIKQNHYKAYMVQLNELYLAIVKEFVNATECTSERKDTIMKSYLGFQLQFQKIHENASTQLIGRFEQIYNNRIDQFDLYSKEIEDLKEITEKICDLFTDKINNLNNLEEINDRLAIDIQLKFEEDKKEILTRKDKEKQDKLNGLIQELEEGRQKTLNEVIQNEENDLNNLIASTIEDIDLNQVLAHLNGIINNQIDKRFDIISELDEEHLSEIIRVNQVIGKETEIEIKKSIENTIPRLTENGVSEYDIEKMLKGFSASSKKLKTLQDNERQKQMAELTKKMDARNKIIEQTTKDHKAEQNVVFNREISIMDELINQQSALSNEERDRIISDFNKNKNNLERGLAVTRLEQHAKINELISNKKKNFMNEIDKEFYELMEDEIRRQSKKQTDKDIYQIQNDVRVKFIQDYLETKLDAIKSEQWKSDLDSDLQNIREELSKERLNQLTAKEEEIAVQLMLLQIQKAKLEMELKEGNEALYNLRLGAINTVENNEKAEDVCTNYHQSKKSVQKIINTEREIQLEKFNSLKKKEQFKKGLKKQIDPTYTAENETDIIKEQQNIEFEKQQTNLKSIENERKVEIDNLKMIFANTKHTKDELRDLLKTEYPLKTNKEIEAMLVEIYPNEQKQPTEVKERPKSSLRDAFKKMKELNQISKKDNKLYDLVQQLRSPKKTINSSEDNIRNVTVNDRPIHKKRKRKKSKRNIESDTENIHNDENMHDSDF